MTDSSYSEATSSHDELKKRMDEGYVCEVVIKGAYVMESTRITPEGTTNYPILVLVRDTPSWYPEDSEEEFFVLVMTPHSPEDPRFSELTDEKKKEIEEKLIDLVRTTFLQES